MTDIATRTPGPWIVETWPTKYPDLFTYNVIAPQGWAEVATDEHKSCSVATGLDSREDAHLIAAAPALYDALMDAAAACEWAIPFAETPQDAELWRYRAKQARAALALATP